MVHMEDIYRSNPRVDEKNKCAFFNGVFRNGERKKIDCLREMRGKYVTIVKEPPGPLEFCEVEVMGYSFMGKMLLYFRFDFILCVGVSVKLFFVFFPHDLKKK